MLAVCIGRHGGEDSVVVLVDHLVLDVFEISIDIIVRAGGIVG